MQRTFQTRIVAVLLAFFTVAAVVFAGFNLLQEDRYQVPADGVWWVEGHGGLVAQRVPDDSPGERAGVKPGDLLLAANGVPTPRWSSLVRQMWHTRAYNTIHYTLVRNGIRLPNVPVILDIQDRSINQGFRFIALVYLGIGLYVLLRRWTAPHSTHFYIFCLVSFVLYSFWYTGKLNTFDWMVYWSGIGAGALQPALFLHFALAFSRDRKKGRLAGGADVRARRAAGGAAGDGHRAVVGHGAGAAPPGPGVGRLPGGVLSTGGGWCSMCITAGPGLRWSGSS